MYIKKQVTDRELSYVQSNKNVKHICLLLGFEQDRTHKMQHGHETKLKMIYYYIV